MIRVPNPTATGGLAGLLLALLVPSSLAEESRLVLTSPLDYQVVQRTRPDQGTLPVSGRLGVEASAGDVLEARLSEGNGSGGWRSLVVLTPGQTTFRADLNAPAGGWMPVEVRLRRGDAVLAEVKTPHVGVGEVFVIAGQSNSANHGEERQVSGSGRTASFTGTAWQPANDPQPGASGDGGSFVPPFADALAARFGVPVGIVAVGAGGTSVREWLPRGSTFPNPPTVLGNVTRRDSGEWESRGVLFDTLAARLKAMGVHGVRAVLWHQGESDANQKDPSRTFPGNRYRDAMEQLIRDSRAAAGWDVPWFVARASYHTPDDPGSPDLRAAQQALCDSGVALSGPDTDALTGRFRDGGGAGVHFSGFGLRAHGRLWAGLVGSWLETQGIPPQAPSTAPLHPAGPTPGFTPAGWEPFSVAGRRAFVFLPEPARRSQPQPWVFYAPTLPGLPDAAEAWMHGQLLAAGIAVAGVDVGEGYGSPATHAAFDALYRELVGFRGFAPKPCLLGRSRGGLWVTSWALASPDKVAGIAGIYPVFDFRSYPGLTNAAPAYGLTPTELAARSREFNPVERIQELARARIPVMLLHGDADTVVPLRENSGDVARRYRESGAESLITLTVLPGQGHNYHEVFFHSADLVAFVIERARAGASR